MPEYEREEDINDGTKSGKWTLWSQELENAKKFREKWDAEVKIYNDIYNNNTDGATFAENRYPILWANIQTLKPLIYSNLPLADIRRRYAGKDSVARLSSIMLERGVNYFMEQGFASVAISKARDDALICGLGEVKIRFKADIVKLEKKKKDEEVASTEEPQEEEEPDEEVAGKNIEYDFISYEDYLTSPANDESLIRWKAYRHKRSRDELVEQFGKKIGESIKLTESIREDEASAQKDANEHQTFKRAEIWEIWHKDEKKVIFWSHGYNEGLLSEQDDVYNLSTFFPSPPSLNLGRINGTILPVPPYRMYKAQAKELNIVTDRITSIVEQIKAGGLYNQILGASAVDSLQNNGDGVYTPVAFDPNVNISNLIYTKDLSQLANVLSALRTHKIEIIEEIRDITGISDIVRGTSKASETATAQRLKGNFAVSRMQTQQQAMSEFIRDLIRITGELLAENWSGEELAAISGITVLKQADMDAKMAELTMTQQLSPEELQQAVKMMKAEQDRTIKLEGAATDVMLKEVEDLLRDDKLRCYAIDIESEMTAAIDAEQVKRDRVEFMNTISLFIQQNIPLVQAGLLPMDVFKAMMGFVARPFKVGRDIEEAMELIGETSEEDNAESEEPSADMIDAQLKERELDIKEKKVDGGFKIEEAKLQLSSAEQENDRQSEFTLEQLRRLAKQSGEAV